MILNRFCAFLHEYNSTGFLFVWFYVQEYDFLHLFLWIITVVSVICRPLYLKNSASCFAPIHAELNIKQSSLADLNIGPTFSKNLCKFKRKAYSLIVFSFIYLGYVYSSESSKEAIISGIPIFCSLDSNTRWLVPNKAVTVLSHISINPKVKSVTLKGHYNTDKLQKTIKPFADLKFSSFSFDKMKQSCHNSLLKDHIPESASKIERISYIDKNNPHQEVVIELPPLSDKIQSFDDILQWSSICQAINHKVFGSDINEQFNEVFDSAVLL